uniref:Uncharacterized protein n=1 Tax=Myotis myotis TaxID=51298 RepID=A0A7J7RUR3_MYOMY|nr:hypothetical protein mMyoMyo1_010137 [Myotis myotis]
MCPDPESICGFLVHGMILQPIHTGQGMGCPHTALRHLPIASMVICPRQCRGEAKLECKSSGLALAGLAQWVERRPEDRRVLGSILVKGTYLGCRLLPGLDPGQGSCRRQPINAFLSQRCFSFPLSSTLCKNQWKHILG